MTRRTREDVGRLTPERAEALNRLAARPDSEIDTTDIPEITEIPPQRDSRQGLEALPGQGYHPDRRAARLLFGTCRPQRGFCQHPGERFPGQGNRVVEAVK